MGSPRPLTLKPPMVRPESQQRGFLRNLFQSLSNLGCRHLHQSVASRKISAATYEMFVMCASCKKRLSPGVVLGKGSQETYDAARLSGQAHELPATPSMAH